MESIFSQIITPGMVMLATAAVAVMLFLGRLPYKGKRLNTTKFWKNWGEFVVVAVCCIGVFTPGVTDIPKEQWGNLLVFSMVAALTAQLGRKLLKPLILARLEGKEENNND